VSIGERNFQRLDVSQLARLKMPRIQWIPQFGVVEKSLTVKLTENDIDNLPIMPSMVGGSLLYNAEEPYDNLTASLLGLVGQRWMDSIDEQIYTVNADGMTEEQKGRFFESLKEMLLRSKARAEEAVARGRPVMERIGAGQNMAVTAGMNAVNRHIPANARHAINAGAAAAGDIMRGDWDAAGFNALRGLLPGIGGDLASQAAYWGRPTPLFGGISPREARRIYDAMRGERFAKKNLWLLEVKSALTGDVWNERFNLFATELEYAPYIIAGDKARVGGAVVDTVQGAEPVELRLTTLDDATGSVKLWFAAHHSATAARDGSVGVPGDYAITFKIVHASITRESNVGSHEDMGLFRPVNLDVNLSRREDGLQEVQMTFSQLDTFMRP